MCKKSITNSQPFVKKNEIKMLGPLGGDFFDSHCTSLVCCVGNVNNDEYKQFDDLLAVWAQNGRVTDKRTDGHIAITLCALCIGVVR